MKRKSVKKITQNYNEFIDNFSQRIKIEFPNIYIENGFGKLETNHSERNLSLSYKSQNTRFEDFSFGIIFNPHKNGICIHNFLVNQLLQGKGIGTIVMKIIKNISIECNIPTYLIPIPTTDYGISDEKLRGFYHSFGYKRESTSVYWKYSPSEISLNKQYRMVG